MQSDDRCRKELVKKSRPSCMALAVELLMMTAKAMEPMMVMMPIRLRSTVHGQGRKSSSFRAPAAAVNVRDIERCKMS